MYRSLLAFLPLCFLTPASAQQVVELMVDGVPLWGDSLEVVEELRIGRLMGEAEYTFGSVDDILAHPDGTVWVGDSHLHAIRRYTADGVYMDQVGREGQGPGEFQYISNIRALSDGSVIVWDAGLIRVSRFAANGDFVDSFEPRTHMISGSFEELEVDAEDSIYLIAMTPFAWPEDASERELLSAWRSHDQRTYWLKMDLDGAVVDSVFRVRAEAVGARDVLATHSLISPRGYRVSARNDEYRIRLELGRDSVVELRREAAAVYYARAERAEARRLEKVASDRNGRAVRDIPHSKPPFSRLHADTQGRLWVQLRMPGFVEPDTEGERAARAEACRFFGSPAAECEAVATEWREHLAYDIIGPDGTFFGHIQLPNRHATFEHAEGRKLWVTEEGEYGEEYVVRYRIENAR